MHEIHLGPSDPRAFDSPSVSVTALVLVSLQHATSLDFSLSFMSNLFHSHTHSATWLSLCHTRSSEDKEFTFGVTRSHL